VPKIKSNLSKARALIRWLLAHLIKVCNYSSITRGIMGGEEFAWSAVKFTLYRLLILIVNGETFRLHFLSSEIVISKEQRWFLCVLKTHFNRVGITDAVIKIMQRLWKARRIREAIASHTLSHASFIHTEVRFNLLVSEMGVVIRSSNEERSFDWESSLLPSRKN